MDFYFWSPKKACDPHLIFMNHKYSTYRTTLVYVLIAIASRDQTRNTPSVLGWRALAFNAEYAGTREVNEARRPHTCSGSCAFEEEKTPGKKAEKIRPTENAYESHSRPATTTASRRHVMKHVPRVCPHSLASMDPGFVEIGLVQL